jgi:NAD(P)-dependent dehydrogenase (short-subunit alcohol dehydrogenase family)/ketosteroid isomerase-like protein
MTTTTSHVERVALVAGASRGIGADTAKAFAAAGYSVVLGARDAAALARVVDEIEAVGGRAVAATTDVGDVDSMRGLVDLAVDTFGRLDAAFNNATDGPMPAPVADIDPDEFDLGIRVNVRGTFLGMKFEIPAMLASGGGAIVNMASVAGVRAMTNLAAYVAGKAGIIALTETAALDYADRGVRVNVVAPGPILTHHLERAGEQAQRMAAGSVPMAVLARPAKSPTWSCGCARVSRRSSPGRRSRSTAASSPATSHHRCIAKAKAWCAPERADRVTQEREHPMTTTTADQIRDLGATWVHAELSADIEALDALATDDFRLVGPFGFVLDKQQWLDRYRSGDFATSALTWHDVDVREYGDSVVTIGTQSQEAAYRGSPSNGDFRITHVFVRDRDRWKIAGMQLSPTTFTPPSAPNEGAVRAGA